MHIGAGTNNGTYRTCTFTKAFKNAHCDVSCSTGGLKFGLMLYLRPNFVYASSVGSGSSLHCIGNVAQ